jgi:hypothetical protein
MTTTPRRQGKTEFHSFIFITHIFVFFETACICLFVRKNLKRWQLTIVGLAPAVVGRVGFWNTVST